MKKKQKEDRFKGFDNSSAKKYPRYKISVQGEWERDSDFFDSKVDQVLQKVDATTQRNQSCSSALEDFKKLVKEGNTEKLTDYFKQYGIAPDVAKFGLHRLIAEELRDLSSS